MFLMAMVLPIHFWVRRIKTEGPHNRRRHVPVLSHCDNIYVLRPGFTKISFYLRGRERERESRGHRRRERILIRLFIQPDVELDLMTLGSRPESKSRVGHSMNWTTQAPHHYLAFLFPIGEGAKWEILEKQLLEGGWERGVKPSTGEDEARELT